MENLGSKISQKLNKICSLKGIGLSQFSEMIGVEEETSYQILNEDHKIEIDQFLDFCEEVNLSPERIYSDQIDYKAISFMRNNAYGEYIPEMYLSGVGTKSSSIRSVCLYAETFWGREVVQSSLNHLQVGIEAFNADKLVSFSFVEDLFNCFSRKKWITIDDCFEMGSFFKKSNGTSFLNLDHAHKSIEFSMNKLINDVAPFIEKNFKHQIWNIKSNEALIKSTPNESVLSSLKRKKIGSIFTDSYTDGITEGMMEEIYNGVVKVERLKSISQGDSFGLMRLVFN